MQYLDFEKNVAELESKVSELRQLAPSDEDISIDENIKQLEQKANMALLGYLCRCLTMIQNPMRGIPILYRSSWL